MSVDIFKQLCNRLDRDNDKPVYRQIAQAIQQAAEQGELVPGQSLPPQRQLAQLLGVGEVTVRRALQLLHEQGLLQSRRGSGTALTCEALSGSPHLSPNHHTKGQLRLSVVFTETDDGYPFVHTLVQAIRQASKKIDDITHVVPTPLHLDSVTDEAFSLQTAYVEDRMDGIIFNSPVSFSALSICRKMNIPYVLLFNDFYDGVSPCVQVDYGPGLSDAMTHLLNNGRRRIALVTSDTQRFSANRLSQAFMLLKQAHGLSDEQAWILPAGYQQQHGHDATMTLLRADKPPDAILYSSDYQALGGLSAATSLGIKVPEQLAIIGTGSINTNETVDVQLSTLDLHIDAIGTAAVRAIRTMRTRPSNPLRQTVTSTFQRGATA